MCDTDDPSRREADGAIARVELATTQLKEATTVEGREAARQLLAGALADLDEITDRRLARRHRSAEASGSSSRP